MTIIATFKESWTDEFGGNFPNAYIVIRDFDISEHSKYRSSEGDTEYSKECVTDGLAYVGNFWYDSDRKKEGYKSRPLIVEEDGEFTSAITVDLEHYESVLIQAKDISMEEKAIELIIADIKRRAKKSLL